jgi:ABC-2 type transport system permease protein
MIGLWRLYRAQFRTTAAYQLQYRVALVIWLVELVLEPVVYLVVWSSVAQSAGGQAGGFSAADFAAYYIFFMIVNHLTFTWVMWEFDYRIRTGSFSALLLRPVHPIHGDIADNLTYKVLTAVIIIPTAFLLGAVFKPAVNLTVLNAAAFLASLVLAFFVRFFFEWTLALTAFWTNRVAAVNHLYYVVFLFTAGEIAPLPLLPEAVVRVTAWLPFRWMVSFPIEIAMGRCEPGRLLQGFACQIAWMIAGLCILKLFWRFSVKRYSAVGA